jgi:Tfp pilus assembly protein PilF
MKSLRIAIRERRALNCFVSGEYETAARHFEAIERLHPNHPGVNHNLGLVALARGDHAEAERRFITDLEHYGDHYPRLRVTADNYYLWGRSKDALLYYEKALAEDPPDTSLPLIRKRIEICRDADKYSLAQRSLSVYNDGRALEADGKHTEALACYQDAIGLDETNLTAINNAGVILMNTLGEHTDAARLFERGLALEHISWLAANLEKAHEAIQQEEA